MKVDEFSKKLKIRNDIVEFFEYVIRLAQWAHRQFFVAIIVFASIMLGFVIMRLFCFSESAVRIVGLFFQLAGLFPVLLGVQEAKRIFDHPTMWASTKEAWRRRPRWKPKPITVSVHGTMAGMSSAMAATQRKNVPPDSSIQERVDALEFNFKQIELEASQLKNQTEQNFDRIIDDIAVMNSDHAAKISDISLKLKSANIDGIGWATAGIVWIALGITLSTTSIEVHNVLGASPNHHAQRVEVRL